MRRWLALAATVAFAATALSFAHAEARTCRLRATKGGHACLIWAPEPTTTTTIP